jgi:hypothetical protein
MLCRSKWSAGAERPPRLHRSPDGRPFIERPARGGSHRTEPEASYKRAPFSVLQTTPLASGRRARPRFRAGQPLGSTPAPKCLRPARTLGSQGGDSCGGSLHRAAPPPPPQGAVRVCGARKPSTKHRGSGHVVPTALPASSVHSARAPVVCQPHTPSIVGYSAQRVTCRMQTAALHCTARAHRATAPTARRQPPPPRRCASSFCAAPPPRAGPRPCAACAPWPRRCRLSRSAAREGRGRRRRGRGGGP